MTIKREYISVKHLVEEVCVIVRPLFNHKELYLEVEMPDDLPQIFCDRTRIRQVLLNLLTNAGRFTEKGGVSMKVLLTGDNIEVSVVDTGPGIPTEQQSRLFQPFEQLDSTIRKRHGGTGLGLSISRRLLELHGGKIWVESQEGTGTTFAFRLPVGPRLPVAEKPLRWISAEWANRRPTSHSMISTPVVRPRILILDREGVLKRLLSRSLDDYDLVPVATIDNAIEELSHSPAQALLINEASLGSPTRSLIPSPVLPNGTPAIFCSVPGTGDTCATLGASGYLVKPISLSDLSNALDRLQLTEKTILIVDDEPDALQLFGRMISSLGPEYRTLMARDGQEALRIVEEDRPGAILLDLIMPNVDGFEFLERKRLRAELRDIPTLLISARDAAGYPFVSNGVAVSRSGGLSVRQLLGCIDAVI